MKSEFTTGGGKQEAAIHNQRTTVYESFGSNMGARAGGAHIDVIERVLWAALAEAARFRDLERRLDLEG